MTSMKNLVLAVAAMVGLAGAVLASTSLAGATNRWGLYHWPFANTTPTSFTLTVESDLNSTWGGSNGKEGFLGAAATQWTASVVLDLNVVNQLSSSSSCSALSSKIRVCNRTYGFNGWLGVAQIWITSGNHITAGTVKLNDSYFNTSTYNKAAWRAMVVCQEIGHTVGLDHQDVNFSNKNLGSCMDYTNDPSRNDGLGDNTAPNTHDLAELVIIYTDHTDATSPSSSSKPGGGQGSGSGVGRPSAGEDENGLPLGARRELGDTYVRDLGNGDRLITHVFWVQPGNSGRP